MEDNKNTEEQNKKIMQVLNKLKKFFTEKVTTYVESDKGEYGVISGNDLDELKKSLDNFKIELSAYKEQIGPDNYNKLFDIMDKMSQQNVPTEQINQLIETTKILIEKSSTLQITDYQSQNHGGDMAKVIQMTENGEKIRGGVIVPKNKEKAEEELVGKYTNNEQLQEIFGQFVTSLRQMLEKDNPTNSKEAEQIILSMIKENKWDLSANMAKVAESLREVQDIKKVEKKNIRLGAYRAGIVALLVWGCVNSLNKDMVTVAIQQDEIEHDYGVSEDIDVEVKEVSDIISDNYYYQNGELEEAKEIGTIDENTVPELVAREQRISNMGKLEEIQNDISNIKLELEGIKNPTNSQTLEYEIKLMEKYAETLELKSMMIDEGMEYIGQWSEDNQKHIDSNEMSEKATSEHEKEMEYNSSKQKEYEAKKKEVADNETFNEQKMEFMQGLLELKGIDENAKNISEVAENIYRFSESDLGKKIGKDKLFKFLEDKNLDLFSKFVEQNISVKSEKELKEAYIKLEYAYNTYVRQYCENDKSCVSENKYIQYLEGVSGVGELDEVGKSNFIDIIKGINEIDDLNQGYYSNYGKDDIKETKQKGKVEQLIKHIQNKLDKTKISDYKSMLKEIREIREIKENSKDSIEKGDSKDEEFSK